MHVYRDGSRMVSSAELLRNLGNSIRQLDSAAVSRFAPISELLLEALLRCGAMECALDDVQSRLAREIAPVTDQIARALLEGPRNDSALAISELLYPVESVAEQLAREANWERLRISAPEGFAYYALHPLDYADAFDRAAVESEVYVVGLRTIGTTLSAVVHAAAQRRGLRSQRTTVRPVGHPFDRRTEFDATQREKIREAAGADARFVVVDEGPGLSGSSLLSVADALVENGVERERIVVLCAHQPNPASLCARGAAERWPELRVMAVAGPCRAPADAESNFSGGEWRRTIYSDERDWPATWPQTERLKFLSRDRERLYKFEGLGPSGRDVMERASRLAEAGFSPRVEAAGHGFAAYEFVEGVPLRASDLDAGIVERMARYCAFRAREFGVREDLATPVETLQEMLRVNVREEFGNRTDDFPAFAGRIHRSVFCDGRMMPHEWIRSRDRRILKTDAASHADDHFFPGPTDIAWDLAGAIVEWQMPANAAHEFLAQYCALSGDDATVRMPFFIAAYAAFRLGFCRMAAQSTGEPECSRLRSAADFYRVALARQVSGSARAIPA